MAGGGMEDGGMASGGREDCDMKGGSMAGGGMEDGGMASGVMDGGDMEAGDIKGVDESPGNEDGDKEGEDFLDKSSHFLKQGKLVRPCACSLANKSWQFEPWKTFWLYTSPSPDASSRQTFLVFLNSFPSSLSFFFLCPPLFA